MTLRPTRRPIRPSASTVDPADYVSIVGQSFVKHERAPLLVIGRHAWDRWTLGRLGVPHPKAAAALNRVIQHLGITTLAQLADHARTIGDYRGMGVTAYWTVLAILREAGYDVVDVHHEPVSYGTLKQRARKRQRRGARFTTTSTTRAAPAADRRSSR